ncbi:MAG: HupE/UreJ family protein [Ferruginibacter sp.]
MNSFKLYFSTGWQHIISKEALDHILFIAVLSAAYSFKNWKQVLILVTAFTVGHSLTLALSVYDIIRFNSRLVEFLIPCTIILTALFNFFIKSFDTGLSRLNYCIALLFGLIHGMGFANTIRFMLAGDEAIGLPLLSFNIGLEAGQIVLVAFILLLNFIFVDKLKLNRKWWIWILSLISFMLATKMVINRWP